MVFSSLMDCFELLVIAFTHLSGESFLVLGQVQYRTIYLFIQGNHSLTSGNEKLQFLLFSSNGSVPDLTTGGHPWI